MLMWRWHFLGSFGCGGICIEWTDFLLPSIRFTRKGQHFSREVIDSKIRLPHSYNYSTAQVKCLSCLPLQVKFNLLFIYFLFSQESLLSACLVLVVGFCQALNEVPFCRCPYGILSK